VVDTTYTGKLYITNSTAKELGLRINARSDAYSMLGGIYYVFVCSLEVIVSILKND
jgi:predicted aspartyl protease